MRYSLLFFVIIVVRLNAQAPVLLKISQDSDETYEHNYHLNKAHQSYEAFEKFKKVNTQKNNSMFTNTRNIPIPGIGGRVRALLVDSERNISLAAPSGGGLWRFAADGSSFQPVDDFAPFMTVTDISQNPFNPDEIIISTGDEYQFIRGNGLFRSLDRGITFAPITSTNPSINSDFVITRYVEYHPMRQDELYAISYRNLLRSTDGGNSWNRVYSAEGNIKSIDFNHLGEIIISVFFRGLYKSPLGDLNTFTQISSGLPVGSSNTRIDNSIISAHKADRSIMYSLFADVDPNDPNKQVGKIYKSIDGGNTWIYRGLTNHTIRSTGFVFAFSVHPSNPEILLGGSIGFGYSLDGGTSWLSTSGFEVDFHTISFDPHNQSVAYAGYDQGIGRIHFDQTTVVNIRVGDQVIQEERLLQEEIGKKPGFNTSQIYYGDYYPSEFGDDLVFGQQDGGSFAHLGLIDTRIFVGDGGSIFISKQDPNKIIGCTQLGLLYKTEKGLNPFFRDFIRDSRFYNNHSNFITEFLMNESDGDQIYFSTNSTLERSLDFGSTYDPIFSFSGYRSIKMAMTNSIDPTVYFTGQDNSDYSTSLIRINNAATSPTPHTTTSLFASNERIDRITTDLNDDNVLYATTLSGDIFRINYDINNNISKTSIRGNAAEIIFNIVISVKNKNILIAGTNVGLLYSSDNGNNWNLSQEIPYCQIRDLKYRKDDQRLFVFTYGRGAWATTLNENNCAQSYTGMDRLIGIQSTDAIISTNGPLQSVQTIDARVDYHSGGYIELLEDFQVLIGQQFRLFLDGCND